MRPGEAGRGCCSRTCKKQGKGRKCAPAPDALGCTVREDACRLKTAACPGAADGFCVVLDNGKPFCALGVSAPRARPTTTAIRRSP